MDRRLLNFADTDAVIAEVRLLRHGYRRCANWSLPQISRHLTIAIRFSMRPGPHDPIVQTPQMIETLEKVLATGRLPVVTAPERAVPPGDTPDSAVDDFTNALGELRQFPGPFAPHRFFGPVETAKFHRLHLIHCAHHLGCLIPDPTALH